MAKNKKNKTALRNLVKLMKALDQKYSVKVGIIGAQAQEKHADTDLTNADLGAIHEFGATINVTDKMKGWFYHQGIGKTNEPVVIPTRSFLRVPLLSKEGQKQLRKVVRDNTSSEQILNETIFKADPTLFENLCNLVGLQALQLVQRAFDEGGYPDKWEYISDFTKERRKNDASSPPLTDTSELRNSVTFEVKKVN